MRKLLKLARVMGPSIKCVSKILRKAYICNPLIRTRTCAFQGLEMLVFRKSLRTYLMDDPYLHLLIKSMTTTAQNTVISPNFLVWKFCGKAQFLHSFGRIAQNDAETVLTETNLLVVTISCFCKDYVI